MFRRVAPIHEVSSSEQPEPLPAGPEVEVVAYADDLLLRGRLRVGPTRLTDLLATGAGVLLTQVRITTLRDGVAVREPEVELLHDDLVAITMAGSRGDPQRRLNRPDRPLLALRGGPYRIWGRAHMPPALDPIAFSRHHGPILPLTDVDIAYELDGITVTEALPGLIVNLDLIDSIVDADLRPLDAGFEAFGFARVGS